MEKRALGLETEYGYYPNTYIDLDENQFIWSLSYPNTISRNSQYLINGARLYLDVGHPEYATPECSNIYDLIVYDKAGEYFMGLLVDYQKEKKNKSIILLKNNVSRGEESKEATYGCHENYQIDIISVQSWQRLFELMAPFLVTRQIYCGAGKINNFGFFEISQRSNKILNHMHTLSTSNRPIIHLREEPLADPAKYARLHLILGDANMSEYSTFLKIGTTSLVLRMIEEHFLDQVMSLDDGLLEVLHKVSRDINFSKTFWSSNKRISAINIQEFYLEKAQEFCRNHPVSFEEKQVILMWTYVLDKLKEDPGKLDKKIDWIIKKKLIDEYCQIRKCLYSDSRIKNLDVFYHNVDRKRSIYYLLQSEAKVKRLVSDAAIEIAKENPPKDTRAWVRGNLIKIFRKRNRSYYVDWMLFKINFTGEEFFFQNPLDNYCDFLEELKSRL